MIKRILISVLALCMIISLAACGEDALYAKKNTDSTSATETQNTYKEISSYDKTIKGIEDCLIERKLLTQDIVDKKSDMLYEIIGAKDGYRYSIDNNVFIEIYEYPDTKNATADEVKSAIDKEGTFSIADMDPLTGVYSSDGKFLLVYNASIKSDIYDKIAEVIKQF